MADQSTAIPGSGSGNVYIDSLLWGAGWINGPVTYFFGEGNAVDENGTPFFGHAWHPYEQAAFLQAIALFESVCNIDFVPAASAASADIVWWLNDNNYLAGFLGSHQVPDQTDSDPIYGYFNQQDSSWTEAGLLQGGYAFVTVIHELGHGVGLAHPHDGGPENDRNLFPGVSNSRDTGDNGLNQGIWTMMSYNDGWNLLRSPSDNYGWEGSPMAFDIAALQEIYGANMTYNTGDNSYVLPGANKSGTFFSCIWDAGGIDVIDGSGLTGNAVINLNDAPLTGPNAGGFVSWMAGIRGGFTIANGVVIENAIGGKGNDKITGNEAVNDLVGGLGNDTLNGAAGADSLSGGGGNDLYMVEDIGDQVSETIGGAAGGVDFVRSTASFKLGANVENLELFGTGDIDGTGNDLANILIGTSGNNSLDGGAGADKMNGDGGDDIYRIDTKGDVAIESLAGKAGGTDRIESEIALTLGANLENLTLLGAGDINGIGNALLNEIVGNDGKNSLLGLAGNDTLSGGLGNDTVDGGLGADSLAGGEGDDLYVQDSALDIIAEAGATLNDELRTNQMLSGIKAGIEHYSFVGGKAVNFTADGQDNRLTGTKLADTLSGEDGDDTLNGGAGGDSLLGGDGDDVYVVDNKADKISDSSGKDRVDSAIALILADGLENLTLIGKATVGTGNILGNEMTGNALANRLDGGLGNDTLIGNGGNDIYLVDAAGDDVVETDGSKLGGIDSIISMVDYTLGKFEEILTLDAKGTAALAGGNELNNILIGNGSNNTLDGGDGIDKMAGGAGNDTYIVGTQGDSAIESIKGTPGGTDTVESEISFVLGANLENLTLIGAENSKGTGNTLGNVIIGNGGDNTLLGGAGNDDLTGNGGNDSLDGGVGADTLAGGNGDDIYVQDNAGDKISELGADSNDELRTNQALASVQAGIEHYSFLGAAAVVFTADGADNRISGTKAADKIDGAGGDDTLTGNGGNDTLTGGLGADALTGGAGADSLIGGDGDDSYVVDNFADKIDDSSGTDSVQSTATYVLAAGVENLQLLGGGAIGGTGNGDANVITGNAASNKLSGAGGSDSLGGAGGNDSLFGGDGADTLDGGLGNDVIVGGAGADTIDVSAGNDRIFYQSKLDSGDVVTGFDGDAAGGQDQVNLDQLLDSLGIAAKNRAASVAIQDNGATVEISVDADGNSGNGAELLLVTLNTADDITLGADVILGG